MSADDGIASFTSTCNVVITYNLLTQENVERPICDSLIALKGKADVSLLTPPKDISLINLTVFYLEILMLIAEGTTVPVKNIKISLQLILQI